MSISRRGPVAVHVSDHAFGILDRGELPIETADWSNGLIVTMSAGATIYTGIDRGYVHVSAATLPGPPHDIDAGVAGGPWEEIIEASLTAPYGELRVDAYETGPVADLPVLSTTGAGVYRLRAHARNRDADFDAVRSDSTEDYLLLIWPAPPAPVEIIRATDSCGASIRDAH